MMGSEKCCSFKCPPNFSASDGKSNVSAEDFEGKELWLIRAPLQFDFSQLNGKTVSLKGHTSIESGQGKAYRCTSHEFAGVQLVQGTKDGTLLPVPSKFSGQLTLTEILQPLSISLPPSSNNLPSFPEGVYPRYIPFGAGNPVVCVKGSPKKSKKKKKNKDRSFDEEDSVTEQVSSNVQEIRQMLPPPQPKQKKRKRGSDAQEDSLNVSSEDVVSSPRKKKKKKDKDADQRMDGTSDEATETELRPLLLSENAILHKSPSLQGSASKKKKDKKQKERVDHPEPMEVNSEEAVVDQLQPSQESDLAQSNDVSMSDLPSSQDQDGDASPSKKKKKKRKSKDMNQIAIKQEVDSEEAVANELQPSQESDLVQTNDVSMNDLPSSQDQDRDASPSKKKKKRKLKEMNQIAIKQEVMNDEPMDAGDQCYEMPWAETPPPEKGNIKERLNIAIKQEAMSDPENEGDDGLDYPNESEIPSMESSSIHISSNTTAEPPHWGNEDIGEVVKREVMSPARSNKGNPPQTYTSGLKEMGIHSSSPSSSSKKAKKATKQLTPAGIVIKQEVRSPEYPTTSTMNEANDSMSRKNHKRKERQEQAQTSIQLKTEEMGEDMAAVVAALIPAMCEYESDTAGPSTSQSQETGSSKKKVKKKKQQGGLMSKMPSMSKIKDEPHYTTDVEEAMISSTLLPDKAPKKSRKKKPNKN